MQAKFIRNALIAAAMLFPAGLTLAADGKPAAAGDSKAVVAPGAAEKSGKAKDAKAAGKVKLVDINSASKAELKKLPGIGDAEADKIIAGRPYYTKAALVGKNIIPEGTYASIRKIIVAKQTKAMMANPGK